jgi:hypothetical protein
MADATCATCPAFHRDPEGVDGACRAAPPTIIEDAPWPRIFGTDWCMQHPLRRRHLLALHAMTGLAADAEFRGDVGHTAYGFADSLLAEAAKAATPDTDPEEILP